MGAWLTPMSASTCTEMQMLHSNEPSSIPRPVSESTMNWLKFSTSQGHQACFGRTSTVMNPDSEFNCYIDSKSKCEDFLLHKGQEQPYRHSLCGGRLLSIEALQKGALLRASSQESMSMKLFGCCDRFKLRSCW